MIFLTNKNFFCQLKNSILILKIKLQINTKELSIYLKEFMFLTHVLFII